jgi:hypothetical protein
MKIIWSVLDELVGRAKMALRGPTPPIAVIPHDGVNLSYERTGSMERRETREITPQIEEMLRQPLNDLAFQIHQDRCKQAGQTVHGMNTVDWNEAKAAILAEMTTLGLNADEYLAMYNSRRQQIETGNNGQPVQAILTVQADGETRQGSERREVAAVGSNS